MTVTVSIAKICVVLFAFIVCTVSARKCYVCNSQQNPSCNDANQISQLYQDCSQTGGQTGGFGYQGQQGGFNQPGQQFGQQGGGGYGGDRCFKMMIVGGQQQGPIGGGGMQMQNQPTVIRGCGAPPQMQGQPGGMGMQGMGMVGSDGCSWNGNVMTCSCDWNYCNGSTRVSTTSLFRILGLAVIASLLSFSSRKL